MTGSRHDLCQCLNTMESMLYYMILVESKRSNHAHIVPVLAVQVFVSCFHRKISSMIDDSEISSLYDRKQQDFFCSSFNHVIYEYE